MDASRHTDGAVGLVQGIFVVVGAPPQRILLAARDAVRLPSTADGPARCTRTYTAGCRSGMRFACRSRRASTTSAYIRDLI